MEAPEAGGSDGEDATLNYSLSVGWGVICQL